MITKRWQKFSNHTERFRDSATELSKAESYFLRLTFCETHRADTSVNPEVW